WQAPIAFGNLKTALFLGFSAAMLGISGFESSANFVEEQEAGVFPKTLRNMWAIVSFFNPVIAILIIGVIPLAQVGENKE
ncbi:MAG: amino acid permease, partial [Flavobacterium sp.]